MDNLVILKNGKAMVSSKDVADNFDRIHRNVLRDIKNLDCSDEFRLLSFESSSYMSLQNKELPCVNMTRDGFTFLCMGFNGKKSAKWKEAYIKAFNEMELLLSTQNTIDERMSQLSIEGKSLKEAGSDWGKQGQLISQKKKEHVKKANELLSEVQHFLDLF